MRPVETKNRQVWGWMLLAVVLTGLDCLAGTDYRWGAYGGATIGVIGGIVGAYYGIRRSSPAEEGALMSRFLLCWFLLLALGAVGFWLMPGDYRFLVFIPIGLGLFVLVRHANRRRSALQIGQPRRPVET
jgi:hypothetical protein